MFNLYFNIGNIGKVLFLMYLVTDDNKSDKNIYRFLKKKKIFPFNRFDDVIIIIYEIDKIYITNVHIILNDNSRRNFKRKIKLKIDFNKMLNKLSHQGLIMMIEYIIPFRNFYISKIKTMTYDIKYRKKIQKIGGIRCSFDKN